jgi:flavodoxin
MKPLIIVYSYHHMNTLKVANTFGEILDAEVININNENTKNIDESRIIAFGAGIDSAKHYPQLLNYVEGLKNQNNKKVFIFSTCAIMGERKIKKDHETLRNMLKLKGYLIQDEFSCKGYNTNLFLKYFGGMNKGRPNSDDLKSAEEFAQRMKSKLAN